MQYLHKGGNTDVRAVCFFVRFMSEKRRQFRDVKDKEGRLADKICPLTSDPEQFIIKVYLRMISSQ